MNRIILFGLLALMVSATAKAQILQPVTWSYAAKRLNNDKASVYLKATMEPGWHLYSTKQQEGGPVKTTFIFDKKGYALIGALTEPKPLIRFEKAFDMEVAFFQVSVIFSQRVRLPAPGSVGGKLTYMACNDQQCLPPETIGFSIPVK